MSNPNIPDIEDANTFTVILAVLAAVVVVTLLFMVAWNLGVVGLAASLGLVATKITFWTALGGVALLAFVRALLASVGRGRKSGVS